MENEEKCTQCSKPATYYFGFGKYLCDDCELWFLREVSSPIPTIVVVVGSIIGMLLLILIG